MRIGDEGGRNGSVGVTGILADVKQVGSTKNIDDVVNKSWQIRMYPDKPLHSKKFSIDDDINMCVIERSPPSVLSPP